MRVILNLLFVIVGGACSGGLNSAPAVQADPLVSATQDASKAKAPAKVEISAVEGIRPFARVGNILLAGQPTEKALSSLRDGGVTVVVDLRQPSESRGFDEASVVPQLGMTYVPLGFGGASELTDSLLNEARQLLAGHRKDGKGDLVLHCASSNRVGAVWLASRVLDEGLTWKQALEEAHSVGLRSAEMEQVVREYVIGAGNRELGKVKIEIRAKLPDVARIDVTELALRIKKKTAPLLIDVREKAEYGVSHLPSAKRAVNLDEALALLKSTPKNTEVVVYCSVGYRSGHLADKLGSAGFTNVRNLEGSIFEWANTGQVVHRDGKPVNEVHPFDETWGKLLAPRFWRPRK